MYSITDWMNNEPVPEYETLKDAIVVLSSFLKGVLTPEGMMLWQFLPNPHLRGQRPIDLLMSTDSSDWSLTIDAAASYYDNGYS